MSLLQELGSRKSYICATLDIDSETLDEFFELTGLDLSDVAHIDECYEALEAWVMSEGEKLPEESLKGFDYTSMIAKGEFVFKSDLWKKRHSIA